MQNVAIEIRDDPNDPAAMIIKVNPYVLQMPRGRRNEKIKFTLASNRFHFGADPYRAVKIENNAGQFSGNAHGQGPDRGKVVTLDDQNSDTDLYKYAIMVEDGNGQTLAIDPLIKNDG